VSVSGFEIGTGRLSGRNKTLGAVGTVVVVSLCLIDMIALRGDRVAHDSASFDGHEPARIEITRPYEKHLVEVGTRYRRDRKTRGRAIELRLLDPEGATVYETSELAARKTRFFSFTPMVAGEYRLEVEENALLVKSTRGSADVDVYVNDRRMLGRLFAALPF
jgi:hypothetical protein